MATSRKNVYRAALGHRDFRWLMIGCATSGVGDFLYMVALAGIIWERTHSAPWVTASVVLRQLPPALLPPLAGALADKVDRRRLLIGLDLARAAAMAAMAVNAVLHGPIAVLIALAVIVSALGTPVNPANVGLIPQLVPEADLAAANSVQAAIDSLALLVGPAVGALLLLLGSPSVAFSINGATFILSAFCLAQLRHGGHHAAQPTVGSNAAEPAAAPAVEARLTPAKQAGVLRTMASSPALVIVVAAVAAACYAVGSTSVLFVVLSAQRLGTGAHGQGFLLAAVGIGGLLGSQVADRLAAGTSVGRATTGCLVVVGVSIGALAFVSNIAVACALAFTFGAGYLVTEILLTTFLQRLLDRSILGRATGLVDSAAYFAMLLGSLLSGMLVAAVGLSAALAVAAVIPLAVAVVGYRTSSALDRAAAAQVRQLQPRVAVLRSVGALAGADQAGLERLARALTEQEVPAGRVVVAHGDPAADFFVVVSGRLRVDVAGTTAQVPPLDAGDFFGEIGLLQARPRTATVVAETDVTLFQVPGDVFLEVVQAAPDVAASLRDVVGLRLARTGALAGR